MAQRKESASQTAGPYVHIGCVPSFAGLKGMYRGHDLGSEMIQDGHAGAEITLTGHIYDGSDAPVTDALIEIWQAGPDGSFDTPGFQNWGRQPTDAVTGAYTFKTLKPGRQAGQAPHILMWIVARGINLGLTTRVYFPDEDNSGDPVFGLAGARSNTLLATATDGGYHFDVHLQGPQETVFFDV